MMFEKFLNLRGLRILTVILWTISINGCVDSSKVSTDEAVTIIHCVIGEETRDSAIIMDKINEKLEKELNVKLKLKYVSWDKWNLILSGGDYFDSIAVGEARAFWTDAKKNAFAEITDEDLSEFAPHIAKSNPEFLAVGKLDNKRYAIPQLEYKVNTNCLIVRGDLMDKYGIKSVNNLEEFGEYLDAIAKNELEMIPYDVNGAMAYTLMALFAVNKGWVAPGPSSAVNPIQLSVNEGDENFLKLFKSIDTPEVLEFSKLMKDWKDRGYWSRSALSSKTDSRESFKANRSASAWASLESFASMRAEFENDERAGWDIRAYYAYNEHPSVYSFMTNAISITNMSSHKEKTLQVIDFLLSDEECYRLLRYGVEGIHYSLTSDNKVTQHGETSGYFAPSIATGLINSELDYETYFQWEGAYDILNRINDKITKNTPDRVAVNFVPDDSEFLEIKSALNLVYQQYTLPRILGFVDNVEETLANERQKLKEAGINEYHDALQKQFDEYLRSIGR